MADAESAIASFGKIAEMLAQLDAGDVATFSTHADDLDGHCADFTADDALVQFMVRILYSSVSESLYCCHVPSVCCGPGGQFLSHIRARLHKLGFYVSPAATQESVQKGKSILIQW